MLKKIVLTCGILSSLLYIAMNIFIPMRFVGYNSASQTVSELSAIGVPTRTLWVLLGVVYTLLVIAFGYGVWKLAGQNRSLRIAGFLILLYGIISLFWPFFPMHQREVLAVNGNALTDTMHLVIASVTVLFMMLAMGFGAAAFGKRFAFYSILTILILMIFGALTGIDTPKVKADLPTPWIGVWERINIGVFLFWIIVLAVILLRGKDIPESVKNNDTQI